MAKNQFQKICTITTMPEKLRNNENKSDSKNHICTYNNINKTGTIYIQDKAEACLALIPTVRYPKHVSTHNEA